MADTTIKIREETRTALHELQREYGFASMDELQRHLSSMARTEQTAKNVSELAPAIKAVQELSHRICSILSGAGDTVLTMRESHRETLTAQKESSEKTAENQQKRINELEERLAENDSAGLQSENIRLKSELETAGHRIKKMELEHERAMLDLEKKLYSEYREQDSRKKTGTGKKSADS